jgi:O-antigen ligase
MRIDYIRNRSSTLIKEQHESLVKAFPSQMDEAIRTLIGSLIISIEFGIKSSLIRQVGAALSIGFLLAAAILTFGPVYTLMGMIGIFVLFFAFFYPEIIVLILLAFVLELIPSKLNLSFSLFIGHFFVTDMLFAMLLVIGTIRMITEKAFRFIRTPLDIPVLLFFGAALVGVITSVRSNGIPFSYTTPEARVYLYYSIYFIVTNLIRTSSQLIRFIRGILLIGVLVAVTMVIRAMLGRSYLIFSNADAVQGEGVVRLFNPGFVLCFISLVVLVCEKALNNDQRSYFVHYLVILLFGVAILTTVSRNLLVALAISFIGLAIILRKVGISRVFIVLLFIGAIALFGISALMLLGVGDRFLQYILAFFQRTSNMFSNRIMTSQENVLIRWDEIEYAWQKIIQNPILGIGFRNPYRPAFYLGDPLTYFLHNAYTSIWLKTGLVGLIPFLWLSFLFLMRGLRQWRELQDRFLSAVILGSTLAYIGLMLSNLVAPTFVQDTSALIFGVIMGVNELAFAQSKTKVKMKEG